MWNEKIVKDYFQAWIENDIEIIKIIFSQNIVYSECYGPEYHGLQQILKWFTDWNKLGTVLEWNIKRFVHQNNTTIVEWYFKCKYNNVIDGFDGVSIIDFDDNKKIIEVKEFQSKAKHNFPYRSNETD